MTGGEPTAAEVLRPTLFGDLPVARWPPDDEATDPPWDGFVRARAHLADGDQDLAIREWAAIATAGAVGGVASRHVLQAWHHLRGVGVQPDPTVAGQVLGVVAEVAVEDGHDVLAAYADGSARYLNHAGGASVVDDAGEAVRARVLAVVDAGQELAGRIGPWDGATLPPLPAGHTRITLLTPGGFRFGQGPDDSLRADPRSHALFAAATDLLVAVVALR